MEIYYLLIYTIHNKLSVYSSRGFCFVLPRVGITLGVETQHKVFWAAENDLKNLKPGKFEKEPNL